MTKAEFNMKFALCAGIVLAVCVSPVMTKNEPRRPHILGISEVEITSSNLPSARTFYTTLAGPGETCNWCEKAPSPMILLPSGQTINLSDVPPRNSSFLLSITFLVDSERTLKEFLKTNKIAYKEINEQFSYHPRKIALVDPEGHQLYFVEQQFQSKGSFRIIHAGFVVHDRASEDHFYKDILGFHLYWQGGMKEETSWVAMQVPDGTDWVEYMLNIPSDASKHTLGVMNHIALGAPDIHAVQKQLLTNGMKLTEEPKIGRDGKWQLNVYDPDETRVEFMEFTPVEKPCCSEFTGPHPKP
jgi:catechol 2,3-dioxygenase-like lactoylglutathione lyase family enzyme